MLDKIRLEIMHAKVQAAFDAIWKLEAKKSRCDAHGGAEYRRVRQLVDDGHLALHIAQWIHALANQSAEECT